MKLLLRENKLLLRPAGQGGGIVVTDDPEQCDCCQGQPFYRCCTGLCFATRAPDDQPPGVNATQLQIGGTLDTQDRHDQPAFGDVVTKEFQNSWGKTTNHDLNWGANNCPGPLQRSESRTVKDFTWCGDLIRNTWLVGGFTGAFDAPQPNVYRFTLSVQSISRMFISGGAPPDCETGQSAVGDEPLAYSCSVAFNTATQTTTITRSDENGTVSYPPTGGTVTTNALITPIGLDPDHPCLVGFALDLTQELLSPVPQFNRPTRLFHHAQLQIRMIGIAPCVNGVPQPSPPPAGLVAPPPLDASALDPRIAQTLDLQARGGGCVGCGQ